jgi:signal transduction histidine kinase
VQAMPNGGNLTVAVHGKRNQVLISVEDTGEGITEEAQEKIFKPLFTTKSKGQGFGLAVVKRLVEAQGGTISFKSKVGKGTKFLVEFPAQKERPE